MQQFDLGWVHEFLKDYNSILLGGGCLAITWCIAKIGLLSHGKSQLRKELAIAKREFEKYRAECALPTSVLLVNAQTKLESARNSHTLAMEELKRNRVRSLEGLVEDLLNVTSGNGDGCTIEEATDCVLKLYEATKGELDAERATELGHGSGAETPRRPADCD